MVGGKQKNIYEKYKQEFSGYLVSFSLNKFSKLRKHKNRKKKRFFFLMFSSNASIRCPHDLDVTSESCVWKLNYILAKYKQTTNLD